MEIGLELGGGAELLCGGEKKRRLTLDTLPDGEKWSLRRLLIHMRDAIITERPDLFLQGETVRPGILVLVNDTDWELLGTLDYLLQPNDTVAFISTLHGG